MMDVIGDVVTELWDGQPEVGRLLMVQEQRNTLTGTGYRYLMDLWTGGGPLGTIIGYGSMSLRYATTQYSDTVAVGRESIATNKVKFSGTFATAGAMNTIDFFWLWSNDATAPYGGPFYHSTTVSPFNKEDGQSLVCRWTITFV